MSRLENFQDGMEEAAEFCAVHTAAAHRAHAVLAERQDMGPALADYTAALSELLSVVVAAQRLFAELTIGRITIVNFAASAGALDAYRTRSMRKVEAAERNLRILYLVPRGTA